MLKMMAADNDDAYNLTPGFILETVEAARKFVSKEKSRSNVTTGKEHLRVAAFLQWPAERVSNALAQLSAIDDGSLAKEAVESLPTIHHATVLHRRHCQLRGSNR